MIRSKAKRAGKSPEKFIEAMVERDLLAEKSFNEILRPIRADVKASGLTPERLDEIVDEARTHHHANQRGGR